MELVTYPIQSASENQIKSYMLTKFNDPSIKKNTAHVDFNFKKLDNNRFKQLNKYPAISEHATVKYYFDQSIDKTKLARKK